MTQQLFEDLTADPPPSTIDVPAIVRREKRRRSAVRVGLPVAAVLAVASAIAVLGPTTLLPVRIRSTRGPVPSGDGR